MIFLYKLRLAVFTAIGFLGGIFLVFSLGNFLLGFLLAILWTIIVLFIGELCAQRAYNKTVMSFLDNCNISEYLERQQKVCDRVKKEPIRSDMLMNMAVGCIMMGDINRAEYYLKMVKTLENKGYTNIKSNIIYLNHIANIHLRRNDIDKAQACISEIDKLLALGKIPAFEKAQLDRCNVENKAVVDLLCGNIDAAAAILSFLLRSESRLVERVELSCFLAECYLKKGDAHRSAEYCRFVIANGKDTYCVQKARNIIEELNRQLNSSYEE